jgi:hypothetical protein
MKWLVDWPQLALVSMSVRVNNAITNGSGFKMLLSVVRLSRYI